MATKEFAQPIPAPEQLRTLEHLDTSKRELPYAKDVHAAVRKSPSMTKALAFAFAVHAGGGLGLAYGKDAIHKAQEVRADIQHQLEKNFEPLQHSPDRLRVARKALLEQEGETFESGSFVLDAEALDEDLDGRHENHELPRQRYQELEQHVRAHLASMGAGEHPSVEQVYQAIVESTKELGYNYQGVGGTLMSDLLRYKSGSCEQISLLVASLAHDVGRIQNISLRRYLPQEVHDARGVHMSKAHMAPVVTMNTPNGPVVFDLVAGALAVRSTSDTPLEHLPRRFLYPHMHYTDASGSAAERSANAASMQPFYFPEGDNDPFEGSAPFFSTGIMSARSAASIESPPVTRSQAELEIEYVGDRNEYNTNRRYLNENVANDWWALTPPNERIINTYQTEHLMLFDTPEAIATAGATASSPSPHAEQPPSELNPTDNNEAQGVSSFIQRLERMRIFLPQRDSSVDTHVIDARLLMQWRLAESVAERSHNPLAVNFARQQQEAVRGRFSEVVIREIWTRFDSDELGVQANYPALEGIVLALADQPLIQQALRNKLQRHGPVSAQLLRDLLRVRSTQAMALEAINRQPIAEQYTTAAAVDSDMCDAFHGDTRFVHLIRLQTHIRDRKLEIYRAVFGEDDPDTHHDDAGDLVDSSYEGYQEQLTQLQALEQEIAQTPDFQHATEGATPAEIAALRTAINDEIMFQT